MTLRYKPLTTILLTALLTTAYAQQKSTISETRPGAFPEKGLSHFIPNAPAEYAAYYGNPTSAADQIHTPIRWYAIEMADDTDYWQNVNYQRVWLELEIGQDIGNAEIGTFISDFQLTASDKGSMHPKLTNFYVFDRPGTTPEEFVEMAMIAKSIPGILFLEPAFIRTTQSIPNDPLWINQWGPLAINAPAAWDYGVGGQSWGVMAVVDDAVDYFHEDLKDQVQYGRDYGYNDADPYPDTTAQTHGTHVTGIMAATINNGKGIAGMCNDTVYFAKITDAHYYDDYPGGGYDAAVIVNALIDISLIDRITAVNLSIGGSAPSAAEEQAYNTLWNSGKLPVAASGNDGIGIVIYPARYEACMAVGALTTDGTDFSLTYYSNYGDHQGVTAPGGDLVTNQGIMSTLPNNEYDVMHGTSMATPLVSGLAGLMKSVNQELNNVDIRNIINATCIDLGEPGWDSYFGHGMINAQAAVEMAINSVSGIANKRRDILTIYPNPSNQQFWIKGIEDMSQGVVEMYDLKGKLVKTEPLTAQNLQAISVSNLPEGVYVVQVKSNKKLITGKFVKSR